MNSTDRADALARPSGFSSVNPLPGGGAPIERRQIPPRPHLIHSDDLLCLQRGELLGVGSPLPLETFLLLFGVVEGLFFRVKSNRRNARSIEDLLTLQANLSSYRSHNSLSVKSDASASTARINSPPASSTSGPCPPPGGLGASVPAALYRCLSR